MSNNRIATENEIQKIMNKQQDKDKRNNKKFIMTVIICLLLFIIGIIIGFLIGRLTKKQGETGEKGDTGLPGANGVDGKDGIDGKDASCDNNTCTKHQNLAKELEEKENIIKEINNNINNTGLSDTQKLDGIKQAIANN